MNSESHINKKIAENYSSWAIAFISVYLNLPKANNLTYWMKSSTQDRYELDGLGSRTGASGATDLIVWTIFFRVAPSGL